MKKIILFASIILLAAPVFAHPPSSIEADYQKDDSELYVFMKHLSRNNNRHYIRMTEISINGEKVAVQSNRQQIDPAQYAFVVVLEPEENDEISIKAYCANGGTKEVSIVIPEEVEGEEEAEEESEVKSRVSAYQKRRTGSKVYSHGSNVYNSKSNIYNSKTNPVKK